MTDTILPTAITPDVKVAVQDILSYKDWSDKPSENIRRMMKTFHDIQAAINFSERQVATGHYYVLHSPLTGLLDKEGK